MRIIKSINIQRPITDVWNEWAVNFDKADQWMAQVVHTEQKIVGKKIEEAPMIGRVCSFSSKQDGPKAIEDIILFDEENYQMNLRVIPENVPVPLRENILKSSLIKVSDSETQVVMDADVSLTLKGRLLSPFIKMALGKNYGELLEELKYFLENKEVHPRKKAKILSR